MWALFYVLVFIFGLCAGSFLNVWVWRTWENISIVQGRSICPYCRHRLIWHDIIPLVSFFLLGGKCRYCKSPISWQYPIVELIMGLLFLFVALWHRGEQTFITLEMICGWLVIFFLFFIFLYDLKYKEILDVATLPLAVMFYLLAIAMDWNTWQSLLLGIVIGGGFFLLQYLISNGKWIGGGDIRLGFLMGAILGWPVIIFALGLAYVLGAIVSLFLIVVKKKKMGDEIAFGTYLVVATFVAMFWGQGIVVWYLSLLR